ncbi:MAG: histidine kinase [Thermoleophilia bacterium]
MALGRPAPAFAALCGVAGAALAVVWADDLWSRATALAVVMGALLGVAPFAPSVAWLGAAALLLTTFPLGELPGGSGSPAVYMLVAAHALAAGRYCRRIPGIAGVAALVAIGVPAAIHVNDASVVFTFIPVAAWGAGAALRERSLVAAALAERVRELEDEREAYADLSVRYERARVASELHDIVAHAISVMVVQATAGQRLAHRDAAATAETFHVIGDAARQAEREMGLLVRLLSDDPAPGRTPDLDLVGELVDRAAGSGLRVTLTLAGERAGTSPEAAHLAYRTVQEGLTNALRYAAGADVAVRVAGEADGLEVEVRNGPAARDASLAGAGTGNGLRGLRERIEGYGGVLEAGPDGPGWRVAARLPRIPRGAVTAS